ncbi:MAG: hypothetical protein ABI823_06735, partial [Bryobacteraceae bacterium]
MEISRRNLSLLLPLLAAAEASGEPSPQPSKTWRFEDLVLKGKTRAVLAGATHTGFEFDMHETELAPGDEPHGAHRHVHEEMIMIREGTMEVTING